MPFVSVEALDVTPKLDRRTLADAVYDHLRDRLVAGRLAPGERLSLREISAFVGVSVMPVREAVNRLVAERALEVTANRVLRVPLASPEQIRDLADIRATVEGYAAERAALARNAAQLRSVRCAPWRRMGLSMRHSMGHSTAGATPGC
jgi:DNA-binding GntR family transcriptional regulator